MVKVEPEHLAAFDRSGYFVLPAVIPEEHLAVLRRTADRLRTICGRVLPQ